MSYKQIMFIGNVGNPQEIRNVTIRGEEVPVLNFSVAVNPIPNANGEPQEPHWFDCALWGKRAVSLAPYIVRGKQVMITSNNFQDEAYTSNAGEARSKIKVNVNEIKLLGGRSDSGDPETANTSRADVPAVTQNSTDIPF